MTIRQAAGYVGALGSDGNLSQGSLAGGVPTSIPCSGGDFGVTLAAGITTLVGLAN